MSDRWKLRQIATRVIPNFAWLLGVLVGLLCGAFIEGFEDGRKAWKWAWTKSVT